MQESGELTRLKQKWWREKRGGGACDSGEPPSAPKLTFDHVKGIFLVLFSGCTIGTTLGIIRWLMNIKKISNFLETPFGEVFKEEVKFVFQFSKTVKPNYLARKSSSQYDASMRSARESNASESRSRSSVNSAINEPQVAPVVVRKVTRKDNREDV
jgi:ionotropic kainate glutamate receptor 2